MLENKHNGVSVDVGAEVDILIVHVKGDKSGEKMREIGRKGFTISLLVLCRRKEESTHVFCFLIDNNVFNSNVYPQYVHEISCDLIR